MLLSRDLAAVAMSCVMLSCAAAGLDDADQDDGDSIGLFPGKGYGGYDGVHTFTVPVAAPLANATWELDPADGTTTSITPPSAYRGSPLRSWAGVTVRAAGSIEIAATADGQRLAALLEITSYLPSEIEVGRQRYLTPVNADTPDRVACVSCHGQADGHDASPLNTMIWSDAELLSAVTTGVYSDTYRLAVQHSWHLTSDETRGIVGYLRSLPLRDR
ncbi:MAG: hypothetical protein R3B48_21260 [Kofleriaceae bacterium]